MEHKFLVAQSLRAGLAKIKALYYQLLADNPLWEQWAYLCLQEQGLEWEPTATDDRFARKSKRLLRRIKGA